MSKTWKAEYKAPKTAQPKPQKVVDRLLMQEAHQAIREALRAPQEAARA